MYSYFKVHICIFMLIESIRIKCSLIRLAIQTERFWSLKHDGFFVCDLLCIHTSLTNADRFPCLYWDQIMWKPLMPSESKSSDFLFMFFNIFICNMGFDLAPYPQSANGIFFINSHLCQTLAKLCHDCATYLNVAYTNLIT